MINKGLLGDRVQTWKTPRELYRKLDKEFYFNFDPCPEEPKFGKKLIFDGLAIEWGKTNFCNPPYSGDNIYKWLKKGIRESEKGKTSVFLLPSRTGTDWFHDLVLGIPLEVRYLRGRIKFENVKWNAPFDSIIVIVRPPMTKAVIR
jgi:site-specific DNA-methyltransferase (adenine-specific)